MQTPISDKHLPNYIRVHRRRTGLSQRELSELLGFRIESIARHEQFQTTPDLLIAIGYEIIFRIPVSELFAGLRDEMAVDVEAKLKSLEDQLGARSARGQGANEIARKLVWLSERKDVNSKSVA